MQFGAMQREVRRQLALNPGGVFWSDDDIAAALNAGLAELADETEYCETYTDVALLADRPYYDCRTVLGPTFLALRQAFDYQTNRWLLPTSVRQFDAHDRRWERVVGEPQRLLFRGLFWLGYWPRIAADVGQIKQYWVTLPDPLVDVTDAPDFPETFHMAVVDFALTELWAADGETQFAMASWAKYLAGESGLQQWVEHRGAAAMREGFGQVTRGLAT